MTPARALLIALVGLALLIKAPPIAGDEQFPRGLMSAAPRVGGGSCTIETRPLSFGAYDPLADTDVDAIGQVIYTCEAGAGGGPPDGRGGGPPDGRGGGPGTRSSAGRTGIRIEMAQGHGNSFAPRHMVGPQNGDLEFNIYLDANRRQVWGTGEGPTLAYIDTNPPNGTPVIVPAFGRIFGRQDVPAGPYGSDVPVRILF